MTKVHALFHAGDGCRPQPRVQVTLVECASGLEDWMAAASWGHSVETGAPFIPKGELECLGPVLSQGCLCCWHYATVTCTRRDIHLFCLAHL